MKKLENKTLNKIYTRFMEKKKSHKVSKLYKFFIYTPILNSFGFIVDRCELVLVSLMGYTCSLAMFYVSFDSHYSRVVRPDDLPINISAGILFFIIFYAVTLNFNLYIMKREKQKHIQESKNEPLSIEDFNDVINNVNEKIVGKLLEENNQKITYRDLEKLDGLLLNEKETLSKIEYEKMIEILGKIDANDLIKKFKDKNTNEIIDSLKKLGLNFKDTELLVKKENLTSKIVKSEKEKEVLFN